MTAITQTIMDRLEEGLAVLWFLMDTVGNSRLQEEIEEVCDMFPGQQDGSEDLWIVDAVHRVFTQVYAEYPREVLRSFGMEPVECPHCAPPERGVVT